MEKDKIMPNDPKFETVILGELMSSDVMHEVQEILSPEAFYDTFNADVYRAILSISNRGERPDPLLVITEMKRLNMPVDPYRLSVMTENCVPDIYPHAIQLAELHRRRKLILLAQKLKVSAFDETQLVNDIVFEAEKGLQDISSDNRATYSTLKEAIKCVFEQINKNASGTNVLTGSETGFYQFDSRGGGLQKSDFIVIAGETSQGKTALAISIALNASDKGDSIAFYSLEMKKEQIAARMMSIKTGIPSNQILYSKLMPEHLEEIDRNISGLYNRKIFFDDRSTSSIDTIISSIRTIKKKFDIDGAIIDYLQILNINMKGSTKEQQMGEAARRFKNLAKELDIWIIALSQLNRDNASLAPSVNRLRDSGQIAEAADVVILVYRPEVYQRPYTGEFKKYNPRGTALINVCKGRNIGDMKFICGFDALTTRFYEINSMDALMPQEIEFEEDERDRPF